MFRQIHSLATRLLLVVMIGTFLSPSLGWGMAASHGQLEHVDLALSVTEAEHEHHDEDEGHEHHEAHASVGHMLSHLPVDLSSATHLFFGTRSEADLPDLLFSIPHSVFEPPYRPPQASRLI